MPLPAPPTVLADASAAMAPTAASLVFIDEPAVLIPTSAEATPLSPAPAPEGRDASTADGEIAALFEGGPMMPVVPGVPIARTPLPPMYADRPQVSSQYARELATGSSVLPADNVVRAGTEMGSASVGAGGYGGENDASSRLPFDAPRGDDEGRRRRAVPFAFVIGGGVAAVLLVVVLVFVARGGGGRAGGREAKRGEVPADAVAVGREEAEPARPPEVPPGDIDTPPGATGGSSSAAATAAVTTAAPEPVTPAPPPTTATEAPSKKAAVPAVRKLGGKKVVLEYDSAAGKKAPATSTAAAKDDSAAVAAARITYFNGNRRLFTGDANGAIKLYQQALAVYPGYVAAYRGLGLAYTQKGEKANALKALRTYVGAVPGARDVGLIRQRIAMLQKK